jgi:hypothetical protein
MGVGGGAGVGADVGTGFSVPV